ncbi:hypothetical protein C0991_005729 [Blastosporella zonata]|nr:hypothetical protein C0991_005729 [Blastosporella zonata]
MINVGRNKGQYIYKDKRYHDGFCVLTTHKFELAAPTLEELEIFESADFVHDSTKILARKQIAFLRMEQGDRVVVVQGDLKEMVEHIVTVSQDDKEATIVFDDNDLKNAEFAMPLAHLRKQVEVGDCVCVVGGLHGGTVAFVAEVILDTTLVLWSKAFASFLNVDCDNVVFHYDIQRLVAPASRLPQTSHVASGPSKGWQLSPNLPKDTTIHPEIHPNAKYFNRQVKIVCKNHWKNYVGTIRKLLHDDFVLVEITATTTSSVRREKIHLSNLANINDPDLHPFMAVPTLKMLAPPPSAQDILATASSTPMAIPTSRMPLIPSTPIPAGSSADMSPAWNPSSQTPNPHIRFSSNRYIESPRLSPQLKIKVRIHNTKPLLDDCGWKNGDYEGKTGIWKVGEATDAGIAKISIMAPYSVQLVPEKYVTPVRPSRKNERVIVDDIMEEQYCCEMTVLKILANGQQCNV